jgi:hypothetical protein
VEKEAAEGPGANIPDKVIQIIRHFDEKDPASSGTLCCQLMRVFSSYSYYDDSIDEI